MKAIDLPVRASALLLASILAMALGANQNWQVLSMAAATMAAIVLIHRAFTVNGQFTSPTQAAAASPTQAAITAGRANAQLIGTTYGWGGLAMLAVYMFSGLHWRHGWQYGSGMLLIALCLFVYARNVSAPSSPLAKPRALALAALLSPVHGIAAALALLILVASGKLATSKGDWAANHIFVAGGLIVVVISVLSYATYRRLSR
ncbi:MAG TPA: hypothetical protein P5114_07565 [Hyphomicrobiaceae bacterium]|nr:hypothetical protein [Hyphomicrobiaceae bacterium]